LSVWCGRNLRVHLSIGCPRYTTGRKALYDDKLVPGWVKWIKANDYLGMGIPSTTESRLDTRVMYGNPFDGTITIDKDGTVITIKTPMPTCEKCDAQHRGGCIRKILDLKGRWFWVQRTDVVCLHCGGNFGGGSNPRPGGSGLLKHLNRCKMKCGRPVEMEKWNGICGRWGEMDGIHRATMVNM